MTSQTQGPTVDARGLSCPQPLLLTMQALADGPGPLTVIVDSAAAAESVERALSREKRKALVVQNGGETIFNISPK
ncbi:MAG: sulfurtransferase TusA family protein [Deltaproteobacteria bacterium]|jgi:TusA-related sulfurtransferase|nr:sulfurtransferase TusA family protein [Deltaproteobacteria bacterium]